MVRSGYKEGWSNGLKPADDKFCPEEYRMLYSDVVASGMSPWEHYVTLGYVKDHDNELHPPVDFFYPKGYLMQYEDVEIAGMVPWHHYVQSGKKKVEIMD